MRKRSDKVQEMARDKRKFFQRTGGVANIL